MERIYLTQNGIPVGPWTLEQVVENLRSKSLSWTDYLYDEMQKDWVLLLDHPPLLPHFREMTYEVDPQSTLTTQPAVKKAPAAIGSTDKEWFCLRGDNKYGPFGYLEVMKMLQEKNLFEFDYVWNAEMMNWKRVCECEEFKPEQIRALKNSGDAAISEVFFRRRHVRASYGASLIVHNNRQVWKAESLEISSGGCGVMIDNSNLEPGQSLFLHFKAGDGVPPFNAICQVVSKSPSVTEGSWIKYGVKFTSISRQVQLAIKEFTQKDVVEKAA